MEDTIVSIATAMSDAGIGILRISGKDAVSCAEQVLEKPLSGRAANTIRYNRVLAEDGLVLDEALVSVMKAPASYTGEDVVEINTHGGRLVMERVLELLLKRGKERVRLAEPGEFTKRAFLNGKMDLARAEAVQDLIGAQNRFGVRNAARQLSGELSETVRAMRETVLREAAFIEAALDDPDVYAEQLDGYGAQLQVRVTDLLRQMDHLLRLFEEGTLLKDGIRCAIVGKPNSGKSTLFNLLAGQERAIVTDIPGTTRDVIEETVRVDDLLLRVMDTAGIRNAEDFVEQIGVARAKQSADDADLLFLVIDASDKPDPEPLTWVRGKTAMVLFNKTDLLNEEALQEAEAFYLRYLNNETGVEDKNTTPVWIKTSLKDGAGLDRIKDGLKDLYFHGKLCAEETFYLTNIRHKEAVEQAKQALTCVLRAIGEGASEELLVPDLMDAYTALGTIIGEAVGEDLLEKIFSAFCLGK